MTPEPLIPDPLITEPANLTPSNTFTSSDAAPGAGYVNRLTLAVAALGAMALALPAAFATPEDTPKPTPNKKVFGTPSGVIKGSARVVTYDTRFHGEPKGKPYKRVKGAFRLDAFPYPAEGRYSSIFFARKGHFAEHRAYLAKADGRGVELGVILLRPLPPKRGGVVGVVAQVDRHGLHGIRKFKSATVSLTPVSGGKAPQASTDAQHAFRLSAVPGRYRLEVVGNPLVAPAIVEIESGRCDLVVLEARPPLPDPMPIPRRQANK